MRDFIVGHKYSRRDIFRIIGLSEETAGGNWYTGYNKHKDDFYIFCNIGIPGRTGHDYNNQLTGQTLHWYAKSNTHIMQPQIQEMLMPKGPRIIRISTNSQEKGQAPPNSRLTNLKRKNGADPNEVYA